MKRVPGRMTSVGSDNFSSPTTESERTGVYLQNAQTIVEIISDKHLLNTCTNIMSDQEQRWRDYPNNNLQL